MVVFIDHVVNQTDLLKWADSAMYLAKDAGRNAIRLCDPDAVSAPPVTMA